MIYFFGYKIYIKRISPSWSISFISKTHNNLYSIEIMINKIYDHFSLIFRKREKYYLNILKDRTVIMLVKKEVLVMK